MRIHPVVTDKNERYNQLDWVQLTLILRKKKKEKIVACTRNVYTYIYMYNIYAMHIFSLYLSLPLSLSRKRDD